MRRAGHGTSTSNFLAALCGLCLSMTMSASVANPGAELDVEERVSQLLEQMTLEEKLGQMSQLNASHGYPPEYLGDGLRHGRIGSVLNVVDVNVINELQRISVEESRLGIPLLVGRDVVHGFRTTLPIPLGQAATFNPDLARDGARLAAEEAASSGVNWTFAPMIDVTRDPRWGRIAESFGEDTYLTNRFAVALVGGFQGDDLTAHDTIAACAKHFAGYGASESGRDYNTTNIAEHELRNVYLPPFRETVDAGVLTFMAGFNDLNGVPATGNEFLMRKILRDEWGFDGLVVSDWGSIFQLQIHGFTADDKASALAAASAGIDMEMATHLYISHLEDLLEEGKIDIDAIDTAVANILRVKFRLGLFEDPYTRPDEHRSLADEGAMAIAKESALQSVVLLKNDGGALPLNAGSIDSVAIIGPLADAPYEQLGTWIFDGDPELTVTPLSAIRGLVGDSVEVRYVRAMENSRSRASEAFDEAVEAAAASDVALLFLGEESILSGEAHSRADISLPGDQRELVRRIRAAGRPVVAIIMAGRPLTLSDIVDDVDAILFAWHPGTMGGPAIADLVFGLESPSGKLPSTFPRMVGQVPIYYNQKNTGRPASPDRAVLIDEIDTRAAQTSLGNTSYHLDAGFTPLFPFGFGLSYTEFEYRDIEVSAAEMPSDGSLTISAQLTNVGDVAAEEVAQLYVRDLFANVTRPVRELKGFQRVRLEPGESRRVEFELQADDLAFYGRDMTRVVEPGDFHVWIGGNSDTQLQSEFRLVAADGDPSS